MVFGLEFKSNLGKALAWFLVLLVITGLLMAFFPLMQEDNILSLIEGFKEGFSDNVKKILGISQDIDFRNLSDYVPFIYQYLTLFFAIFAIQLGARSLVKEQSAGTIEYLYSQPITRGQILSEKFFANFILYFMVVLLTLASTLGFAYIFGAKFLDIREMLIILAQIIFILFLFGFVFLSIGYFYSALSNRVSHADGGSLLIILLLLVLWVILTLVMQGDEIVSYFPFEAFNPLITIKEGIQFMGILINMAIGVLFLLIAYIVYNSKELKF